MNQELLRRLTRSGAMYLIPAEVCTKRIIRFTVTSQFTTANDILRDWSIISKMASTLLAETQAVDDADQPKSEKEEVPGAEREEPAPGLDKAEVELWIDKALNQCKRPQRSLSCSSELLRNDCETRPNPAGDAAGVLPPAAAEQDPVIEITEMPSNLLGEQALKKLTKFYSVPSLCNQWGAVWPAPGVLPPEGLTDRTDTKSLQLEL